MQDNQSLEELIQELKQLKSRHFDAAIKWYQSHSKTPRFLFRMSGYSLIILSVSIPFFTTVKFQGSEIILSIVALLVAALAGVISFARWDSQWRSFKRAQFTLENLESQWDLHIIEAKQIENVEEAKKVLIEASRSLFEQARATVTSETEEYFEGLQPPQTLKK